MGLHGLEQGYLYIFFTLPYQKLVSVSPAALNAVFRLSPQNCAVKRHSFSRRVIRHRQLDTVSNQQTFTVTTVKDE
jgi:hypothetical protein